VNLTDNKRTGDRQQVVAAFQFVAVLRKAHTSEIFFAQLVLLDHGSHSAIEEEQAMGFS
jgi:hypothetical protein